MYVCIRIPLGFRKWEDEESSKVTRPQSDALVHDRVCNRRAVYAIVAVVASLCSKNETSAMEGGRVGLSVWLGGRQIGFIRRG